jgi:hypothetical protein
MKLPNRAAQQKSERDGYQPASPARPSFDGNENNHHGHGDEGKDDGRVLEETEQASGVVDEVNPEPVADHR